MYECTRYLLIVLNIDWLGKNSYSVVSSLSSLEDSSFRLTYNIKGLSIISQIDYYHSNVLVHLLVARVHQPSDSLQAGHLDIPLPDGVDADTKDDENQEDTEHCSEDGGCVLVRVSIRSRHQLFCCCGPSYCCSCGCGLPRCWCRGCCWFIFYAKNPCQLNRRW